MAISSSTLTGIPILRSGGGGSPPTQEQGAVTQGSVWNWTSFVYDDMEHVQELQFPQSVRTYSAMRNDSQLDGLYSGATWPIRRYKWLLNPNGCDDDKVRRLAKNLNIPVKGDAPSEARGRAKRRFNFKSHLAEALLGIIYGFYPFEQVYKFNETDQLYDIRKLAPRPPVTVDSILLSDDGSPLALRQNVSRDAAQVPEIPIDHLTLYAWDKQGANWYGRSMFRSSYRNWLIKDRLLRVDAIKHERNGVGIPMGIGSPDMTTKEIQDLALYAQTFKAGESAGGAVPHGADMKLMGTQGSLPDTIASIKFHNEEMARRFLMMFLQLGDTLHGSRALGKDFINYFQTAQETLADWFVDTFNEHLIEDYWDYNYGEAEEHTPLVEYERDDDPRFAAADLALMITNGVIQVDDEVEEAVREAMDLPEFDPNAKRSYLAPPPAPPGPPAPDGKIGDVPGQPSTQPGNSNPQFPGQNPDVKAAGSKEVENV